ncbi:HHL296Cp [Eremothecium sinecaudum]|uniref:HHL296Cp n=1 Tax=Eremothecium sinecaudum TaxID=45286 RepID=A0A0X8HVX1_9SACH|nr:HHL296Cp [Eremothecium sinecaudum]AMD22474.1 HHL296Cp [Eremothecium sinecaudum]
MSKVTLEHIPVLRPTEDEFKDPIGYLSQAPIRRIGNTYGMVKLVPPAGFLPPMVLNDETFRFKVRLQTLSELGLLNRSRLFFLKQLKNIMLLRGISPEKIPVEPYCVVDMGTRVYFYDVFIAVIKFYNASAPERSIANRSRKRGREESIKEDLATSRTLVMVPLSQVLADKVLWRQLSKEFNVPREVLASLFKSKISDYYQYLQKQSKGCDSASLIKTLLYQEESPWCQIREDSDSDTDSETETEDTCVICKTQEDSEEMIVCNSCGNCFHDQCLAVPLASAPRDNWMCGNCIVGTGYYGFKEEKLKYSRQEFKSLCAEFDKMCFPGGKPLDSIRVLEDMFWALVSNIDNRLTIRYGADIHHTAPGEVTAFPTMDWIPPEIEKDSAAYKEYLSYATHPMNLINLPSANGSLLPVIGKSISGMTVPWIYIGSTFSTFCWHLEDQYTLSANYQHEGDPKIWYSIPEHSSEAFNNLLRKISPDLFEKQPDLMHQLVTLISPYDNQFIKAGISCYKAVQYPGEYIITYPKCYHAGFNSGYNLNEAVNFTLDLWIPFGLQAIDDYKMTKRKCVFNMWELMFNILKRYLVVPKTLQPSLAIRCHTELLKIFNSEMSIIQRIEDMLDKNESKVMTRRRTTCIHNGERKFKGEQHSIIFSSTENDESQEEPANAYVSDDKNNYDPDSNRRQDENAGENADEEEEKEEEEEEEEEEEDDHDLICSECKTICPFAFVVHVQRFNVYRRRKLPNMTPVEWNNLAAQGIISILCLADYMALVEQTQACKRRKSRHVDTLDKDELHYITEPEEIKDILQKTENMIHNGL